MTDPEVVFERPEGVSLFDVLPADLTSGTSFDYFQKYPGLDEEVYYLLECSTLNNADQDELVRRCQELVDQRNGALLERWNSKRSNPYEQEISIEEIDYTINDEQSGNIPQQCGSVNEPERDEK